MELYEVMRSTAAIREFTDDPLPDDVLATILDNARFAPSGGNRQGAHLVLVTDRATREALAERLVRMTPDTLRNMARDEEPELRRAAVLAMGMKDDAVFIPHLIAALQDDEDFVIRAAKASLKSITGQDFGPGPNPTAGEKKIAADAWAAWVAKQKK